MEQFLPQTDEEWAKVLTPAEFHVLREAGTERPFTGTLLSEDREGIYSCKACGNELFSSETKFDAGCGWPSFYDYANNTAVITDVDYKLGYPRVEVLCAKCGSHLGHVFPDAPQTPTGQRYCMNSVALSFQPVEETQGSAEETKEENPAVSG